MGSELLPNYKVCLPPTRASTCRLWPQIFIKTVSKIDSQQSEGWHKNTEPYPGRSS